MPVRKWDITYKTAKARLNPGAEAQHAGTKTLHGRLFRRDRPALVRIEHNDQAWHRSPMANRFQLRSSFFRGCGRFWTVLFARCALPGAAPGCITCLYIVFGTLWILLSDRLVDWIVADAESIMLVQTGKGLLYILVTAFLVYWLSLSTVRGAAHRAAQERLRFTQNLLEKILASLGDAVIVTDPEFRTIVQCNPAAGRVFGYDESALLGQDPRVLYVSDASFDAFYGTGESVFRGGSVYRVEYPMKRSDGAIIDTEISVSPLEQDLGWRHGVVSVIRDVTARNQAQKSSRDLFTRLEQLVERIPDAVYIKDLQHRFILINDAAAALIGTDCHAAIGKTDHDFFPKAIADAFLERDTLVVRQGSVITFEERVADPDGAMHVLLTSKGPLFDSTGSPDGLFGISRDVTEPIQLRAALEERMKELRTLFETTKCLTRTDEPLEARLKKLVAFIPPGWLYPEHTEARITFEGQAWSTPGFRESPWMQSCPIRRFDSVVGKIEVVVMAPNPEVTSERFLPEEQSLLENIARAVGEAAERRRLEEQYQQAQKLESVGRLAGGVAHDFNNMLSVILGHCEMAMMDLSTENPLHVEFSEIHQAAQRAADLTHQLLAFSRQEVAKPVLIDLNQEIASTLSMLKRLITEDIRLEWQPGPEGFLVRMDLAQCQQILANLVVNARDAIDGDGTIALETSATSIDDERCASFPECVPGDYVVLTVTDTGAGMDEATQSSVFEPFFTTKPEGRGTGLGLAMVYGIVRQNGGAIRVKSAPGRGSTFSILIPRATETAVPTSRAATPTTLPHGTETILLVEDEEQVLRLNARTMESLGYTVLAASGPEEALGIVRNRSEPIDLLVTDIVMPGMNGRDLHEAIACICPGMKCLFISGYTADVIADRGILKEDVHFLQKPFTRSRLADKIREVMGRT